MSRRTITKAAKDVISAHLADPQKLSQVQAMKRLKLGRNYNQFYSLVYQTVCPNK